jgi:hypothetical protein
MGEGHAGEDGRDATLRRPDIAARCPYQTPLRPRLRIADDLTMVEPEKLIPLHGGYRKLKSFQVGQFGRQRLALSLRVLW